MTAARHWVKALAAGNFGAGLSPNPRPQLCLDRGVIPASHRRSRMGIVVRPTPCDGRLVVGVWRKNRASMTGIDGSLVRLTGHFGVWLSGRRKADFLRGRGFALGLPSKGRWFTPPAFVALDTGYSTLKRFTGDLTPVTRTNSPVSRACAGWRPCRALLHLYPVPGSRHAGD